MRYSAVVLAAVSLVLVGGCTGAPQKEELKTKNIEFSEVTPLQEGMPYNFTMEMNIEWPEGGVGDKALKEMQKGITGLLFGSDLETTDLEYAMKEYNRRGVEFYQEENLEYLKDIDQEWGFMMTWSEGIDGSFMPEYDGMVSYIKYIYGYSGGAHGMDAKLCRTFDIKTGEKITEQDIFKRDYEEKLTETLRRRLLEIYEDPEMFFETEIHPSKNFYVTSEGITYIYQRYVIGPYALGIVEVPVPWKEIQDIIR